MTCQYGVMTSAFESCFPQAQYMIDVQEVQETNKMFLKSSTLVCHVLFTL